MRRGLAAIAMLAVACGGARPKSSSDDNEDEDEYDDKQYERVKELARQLDIYGFNKAQTKAELAIRIPKAIDEVADLSSSKPYDAGSKAAELESLNVAVDARDKQRLAAIEERAATLHDARAKAAGDAYPLTERLHRAAAIAYRRSAQPLEPTTLLDMYRVGVTVQVTGVPCPRVTKDLNSLARVSNGLQMQIIANVETCAFDESEVKAEAQHSVTERVQTRVDKKIRKEMSCTTKWKAPNTRFCKRDLACAAREGPGQWVIDKCEPVDVPYEEPVFENKTRVVAVPTRVVTRTYDCRVTFEVRDGDYVERGQGGRTGSQVEAYEDGRRIEGDFNGSLSSDIAMVALGVSSQVHTKLLEMQKRRAAQYEQAAARAGEDGDINEEEENMIRAAATSERLGGLADRYALHTLYMLFGEVKPGAFLR